MSKKSLRKKLVQILLKADITDVGKDIYPSRTVPDAAEQLPVILLYTKDSTFERFDEAPKSYKSTVQVIIEIKCIGDQDEDLDDQMDDLADEVIKAVEDSYDIERDFESINLRSVMKATDGEAQSPIGSCIIIFDVGIMYYPRQDIELPDFKKMDNNFKMNDNQDNDAKDTLILQE